MVVSKVNDRKVPSLAIFDDIIPIPGGRKANHPFWELYTKGRLQGGEKGGLAIWCSTQYYKSLPPVVMNNLSTFVYGSAQINK